MRILPVVPHWFSVDRLDQPEETLSAELDRLESILVQKDAEIRRLKSEMELRGLYIEELHAVLEAQASELSELDDRLRSLEPTEVPARPRRGLLPLSIRVKNTGE